MRFLFSISCPGEFRSNRLRVFASQKGRSIGVMAATRFMLLDISIVNWDEIFVGILGCLFLSHTVQTAQRMVTSVKMVEESVKETIPSPAILSESGRKG